MRRVAHSVLCGFPGLRSSDLRIYEIDKTGRVRQPVHMSSSRLITLRANGQLTLPADVRAQAHADAGDVFIAEVSDEAIVLRPKKLIDASQAYFWSDQWQAAEREADADRKKGRVKRFRSVEELVADLRR